MDTHSLYLILVTAFGFGMLHALDADHIAAVSGLASTRPGFGNSVRFCARWAIGHGLALMVIGIAVLFLGMAIPVELSEFAESLVGLVLILIGAYVLYDLLRKKAHLHFHKHDEMTRHAHWHTHHKHQVREKEETHHHGHGAVMVGLMHGTAGSAPLLALIPLGKLGSPWYGISYLALFGTGVFISMLVFGGVLGSLFSWLNRHGNSFVRSMRALVALGSMSFGSYLLYGSLAS